MAHILGLDIGNRSVKALLLESSLRGSNLLSFVEQKIDEEGGLAGALSTLASQKHLVADQVVVAMPATSEAYHYLSFPFSDAKRIQATMGFEIESQIPYDLSEVVFDYHILKSSKGGGAEVLVATIKKDEIKSLLTTLSQVGIDPRIVTTSPLAYQALLGTVFSSPDSEYPQAILDIGHQRTTLCIGTPNRGMEFARTFTLGGKDLTASIATEFQVSLLDAETWKDHEASVMQGKEVPPEVQKASNAVLRGFAPLVREIRSSLRAYSARTHENVEKLWLAGGTSQLKGLGFLLAQELQTEVATVPLFLEEENSPVSQASAPVAAQAYALALRGLNSSRATKINFRKDEFAFKGHLDYFKGKVGILAAYAGILLLLSLALLGTKFQVLASREANIDKTMHNLTQRVLGQPQKDYLVALSLLKGKGSPAATLPTYSSVNLFTEVSTRAQKVEVIFDEIDVQLDRIRLHGEANDFDGVDRLVTALQSYSCFKEIKRGRTQQTKDGNKIEFDLDVRVQCSTPNANT